MSDTSENYAVAKKTGSARKLVLIPVGCVALAIGAIGIFVPLLPTTPLVLLAAGCFASSSPRMYAWLANTRYFGEYIRNYKEGTGISIGTRAISLLFLWTMLAISSFFMRHSTWVLMILAVVGIAVSIHVLTVGRHRRPSVPTAGTDDL